MVCRKDRGRAGITADRKHNNYQDGGCELANNIIQENAPYADFAERLINLRKEAGLTRDELGKKCGVVGRTIINYEHGTRIPYADTAVKIATTFGLTVEDLLGVGKPELAMARMPEMTHKEKNKTDAERLRSLHLEVARLSVDDLTDEQLLEFSIDMLRASQLAQMELMRRFTNKRYLEKEMIT